MKVYYDKDADLSLVKGKKVTIIGYGSQGHAHAQNLTDSGVKVTVGLRPGGASWDKVKKAKIAVKEVGEAVKGADLVMVLLPDENHAAVWKESALSACRSMPARRWQVWRARDSTRKRQRHCSAWVSPNARSSCLANYPAANATVSTLPSCFAAAATCSFWTNRPTTSTWTPCDRWRKRF